MAPTAERKPRLDVIVHPPKHGAPCPVLLPGHTYTLAGWVQGNYVFLGVSGTGATDTSTWTPGAGSYSKLSVVFNTGASTTSVTVWVHGWYAQGTYFADDISVS